MPFKTIIKEPLVHFLLLGALIFMVHSWLNRGQNQPEDAEIIIQDSDIERLAKAYQQSWSTLPDTSVLKKLLLEDVHAEMLYREALRLNLDHNDEIIRRRLKQKYEFLVKDLAVQNIPTEEDLQAFYQENTSNYQSDNQLTFSHVYFSPDLRNNPMKAAQQFFETHQTDNEITVEVAGNGDAFQMQHQFSEKDRFGVRQIFGKEFSDTLFAKATQTGWLAPIYSGYGVHVVWVSDITKGKILDFAQVKNQVIEDWKANQVQVYNEKLLQQLEEQYEVVYDLEEYKLWFE